MTLGQDMGNSSEGNLPRDEHLNSFGNRRGFVPEVISWLARSGRQDQRDRTPCPRFAPAKAVSVGFSMVRPQPSVFYNDGASSAVTQSQDSHWRRDVPYHRHVPRCLSHRLGRGSGLEAIVADRNRAQKHVARARIILHSAERRSVAEIARLADVSRPVVWRWQRRFAEAGVDGLVVRSTGPRPPRTRPTRPCFHAGADRPCAARPRRESVPNHGVARLVCCPRRAIETTAPRADRSRSISSRRPAPRRNADETPWP